ncbi:hypothetical protein E1264_09145 [Actinomadura sp. KC216]|uniref:hypothetical protein n=1 Tax=Actinomadura sp. KC216 TaxID=2530370 RepID=UPI001043ED1A|nr:hypothetical protein [Actinomadura sp. KC216]TDB89126.1 hypothetical protein E1264_09145 [Actinomadura sp. KC216]
MPELETRLASLTDAQVAQVLQHLFSHFDDSEVPAVTQDEIDARIVADREFLGELAAADPSPATAEDGEVRALIAALAEAVPETRPVIDAAVARAESERTLPIDHDTALSVLAIATSAAILRPRFSIRRKRKKDSDDLQIDLDIRGTQGMGRVLDIITRFLNP